MAFSGRCYRRVTTYAVLAAVVAVLGAVLPVNAQIPDLVVDVSDTTASSGELNTVISVFLDNTVDDVSGFNLWLQLDRPDIMIFQTETEIAVDSFHFKCNVWDGGNCTDSTLVPPDGDWDFLYIVEREVEVGNIDSVGTLCGGWDVLGSTSISGYGYDINVAGFTDLPGGVEPPPIPAGQQGGVLVKLWADVYPIPDSMTDRTVSILVQTDFKDHFGFSRPDGTSIGWIDEIVEDTNCFQCQQWLGEDCLNWIQVTYGPCDSTEIVERTIKVLDTVAVKVHDGSLTVNLPWMCGNINGNDPPVIDISDLVYMVEFMFNFGPEPEPLEAADVDCSGVVDISDIVMMVEYMFNFGPTICPEC